MTGGGDPLPSMGGDGNLKNCSEFGECRCPQCNKFYFDSDTCEIVWRCHGCGTPYDPYTTDPKGPHGYRFTLKRKNLLTGEEFDYGQVKSRGRIAAQDNTRYTLTAANEKCAVPRVYVINSTPSCDCPRGCYGLGYPLGEYGIVEGVRSEATMMLWGWNPEEQIIPFGRGLVGERSLVSFDGVNASHSFPIRRGSLGKYYSFGDNTAFLHTECKYDYVARFGTMRNYPPSRPLEPPEGIYIWFYDLGGVKTEYWWNEGSSEEIYAVANFRLEFHTGWGIPYAPGTFNDPEYVVEPPSPNGPVMRGGSLFLRCLDYTTPIELPEWVSLSSGGYYIPRTDPYTGLPNYIYYVYAPGTRYYMDWPDGEYSPGIPLPGLPGLFRAPPSVNVVRGAPGIPNSQLLHWCNTKPAPFLGQEETEPATAGLITTGGGYIHWESLFT